MVIADEVLNLIDDPSVISLRDFIIEIQATVEIVAVEIVFVGSLLVISRVFVVSSSIGSKL